MIDQFLGPYRFLSNFWIVDIQYEGRVYRSVEHAYQAAKTLDEEFRQLIQKTPSPGAAKRLGRIVMLDPTFEARKLDVMRELLRLKFDPRAHPALYRSLMATKGQELIEGNTWGDTFWGQWNGQGENHLGKLLMELRDSFNETRKQQA